MLGRESYPYILFFIKNQTLNNFGLKLSFNLALWIYLKMVLECERSLATGDRLFIAWWTNSTLLLIQPCSLKKKTRRINITCKYKEFCLKCMLNKKYASNIFYQMQIQAGGQVLTRKVLCFIL